MNLKKDSIVCLWLKDGMQSLKSNNDIISRMADDLAFRVSQTSKFTISDLKDIRDKMTFPMAIINAMIEKEEELLTLEENQNEK